MSTNTAAQESKTSVEPGKKVTITRKIEVFIPHNMPKEERDEKYKWLHDIRYLTFKAANTVVNFQYRMLLDVMDIQKGKEGADGGIKISEARKLAEEEYKTSIQNRTYQIVREAYPGLPSTIASGINSVVYSSFNADIKHILSGEKSVRNYRMGYPIPVLAGTSKIYKVDDEKSGSYFLKWINGVELFLNFGEDRSGNRAIVDRILSGEYKFCDSSLTFNKEKGKWFLLLVVKFDALPVRTDINKVAATNLGMNCPIVVVTNEGEVQHIGDKEHFLLARLQFQRRYKNLQEGLVNAKGGHGRAKKLKALDRLKDAERNFAKGYNHNLSKQLVMFCFKNGIGKIVTEDLLGASQTMNKEFVLRNWSYYELQQLISYKAAQYGIVVEKQDPKNITKTCSCCGIEQEESVDIKKRLYTCHNKECVRYMLPIDIDENAAINLLNKPSGYVPKVGAKKKKKAA